MSDYEVKMEKTTMEVVLEEDGRKHNIYNDSEDHMQWVLVDNEFKKLQEVKVREVVSTVYHYLPNKEINYLISMLSKRVMEEGETDEIRGMISALNIVIPGTGKFKVNRNILVYESK